MSLLKLLKESCSFGVLGTLLFLSFSAHCMDNETADDHNSKMVRQDGAGLALMSLDDDKAANDDEKRFGDLMAKMKKKDPFSSAEFQVLLELQRGGIIRPARFDTLIQTISFNFFRRGQYNGSEIFNPFADEVEFNTPAGHALAKYLAEEHDRLVTETYQKVAVFKDKVSAAAFDHAVLEEYCDLLQMKFSQETFNSINQALFERSYAQCVSPDHFDTLKVSLAAAYRDTDTQWIAEKLLSHLQINFSRYIEAANDETYTAILTTSPFNDDLFARYMRYTYYEPQFNDPYIHDMQTAIFSSLGIAELPATNDMIPTAATNIFSPYLRQFEGNLNLEAIATRCKGRLVGAYNGDYIDKMYSRLSINDVVNGNFEGCEKNSIFYLILEIWPWMNEENYATLMDAYLNRLRLMNVKHDFMRLTLEFLAEEWERNRMSTYREERMNEVCDMFVARQNFFDATGELMNTYREERINEVRDMPVARQKLIDETPVL